MRGKLGWRLVCGLVVLWSCGLSLAQQSLLGGGGSGGSATNAVATIQTNGVNVGTGITSINFTPSGSLTGGVTGAAVTIGIGSVVDGDKGDITISASGATYTVDAGLNATKIADGTVTSAEFQFIGTLTSDAQTQITARALTGAIGSSGLTMNTARLLGRTTSSGAIEEITVGSGLSLAAGALTATGGSFDPAASYSLSGSNNISSVSGILRIAGREIIAVVSNTISLNWSNRALSILTNQSFTLTGSGSAVVDQIYSVIVSNSAVTNITIAWPSNVFWLSTNAIAGSTTVGAASKVRYDLWFDGGVLNGIDYGPNNTNLVAWAAILPTAKQDTLSGITSASVVITTNNAALSSGRVQVGDGGRGVQNATASGAVPIDADGTATTGAQLQTLGVVLSNDTRNLVLTGTLAANGTGVTNIPIVTSATIPMGAWFSNNIAPAPLTPASALVITNSGDSFEFADAVTNAIRTRFALPWDWNGGTVQVELTGMSRFTNGLLATNSVFAVRAAAMPTAGTEDNPTWGTGIWLTNKIHSVNTNFVSYKTISTALTVGNTPTSAKSILWEMQRLGAATGDTTTNLVAIIDFRVYYQSNTRIDFPTATP